MDKTTSIENNYFLKPIIAQKQPTAKKDNEKSVPTLAQQTQARNLSDMAKQFFNVNRPGGGGAPSNGNSGAKPTSQEKALAQFEQKLANTILGGLQPEGVARINSQAEGVARINSSQPDEKPGRVSIEGSFGNQETQQDNAIGHNFPEPSEVFEDELQPDFE